MTRFARAKGSKSSNERLPEEATSWQEMKEQMEQKKQEAESSKKQKEFEQQRRNNYKNFLDECENEKQDTWAEFEENKAENNEKVTKKTKNKMKTNGNQSDDDDAPVEASAKIEPESVVVKKKKPKKSKIVIPSVVKKNEGEQGENKEENAEKPKENDGKSNKKGRNPKENAEKPKKMKKKGEKLQKVKKPESELTEEEKLKIKKSKEKKLRQLEKRKLKKAEEKAKNQSEDNSGDHDDKKQLTTNISQQDRDANKFHHQNPDTNKFHHQDQDTNKFNQNKKRKLNKTDDNEHKRRKPAVESVSMMINGNEVRISYFDGFPIKTEDATRLHQLKKQMISKGISRREIQTALKLERRKAEKALTREKKKVCFNCRKSGHNLSECPNLNGDSSQETIGSGVCFKCGSTEHTHFECKVVKGDNYKFASCFICKEQGHISRQCPDNNRGLYPKGGSCKVCGDVTHLKKDCPKYQAQQEALTVTADTIKFDDIEDLDLGSKATNSFNGKPNKIVKF